MEKPITLEDFKNIREYNIADSIYERVRLVHENLLPLLVNHKNDYIRWAVAKRLSNEENFSISTYLRAELT